MEHGGMDHGGMDMGDGPMCNMNVRISLADIPELHAKTALDALHMGHDESLHNLPLVARPLNIHSPRLPRRRRPLDRRLRTRAGN